MTDKLKSCRSFLCLENISYEQSEGFEITEKQAELLGDLHFRKIDISDEIFVIDRNGYIGSSTKREIEYAKEKGKAIRYYSKGEIPSTCNMLEMSAQMD
ncbi:hypothetical protein K0T92_00485 [Paenibacillus oenotherae]|uniref:Uncharacterized protein n=1 Tax=Paenibacillus oenotherae TaxID=1435645 RepID=A0ABS7D1Z4_9BACL|nr:hypothetical protein [Paenibacillus oenotherae]